MVPPTVADNGSDLPSLDELISLGEAAERSGLSAGHLRLLVNQGKLVKVKEDLYFHTEALATLKAKLVDFLKKNGEISVVQFKDMTQTSRKFTIPLMEYFDTNRVTVRVGEARRLREGA